MSILDDQKKVANSITNLPWQISQAWQECFKVKLPGNIRPLKWSVNLNVNNIIICGMGGSNLASELIRNVYNQQIKVPLVLVRSYNLPEFVNKNSLVIISSYSGNTEESIYCLGQAITKKAKIFCLSSGGQVISLAQKNKLPFYQISKKYNPSDQSRYGLGSQLGAMLAIFNRLKVIKTNQGEILKTIEYLKDLNQLFKPDISETRNLAKSLAKKFKGFMPIIVSADFLGANSHILTNQIQESAKNLAQYNLVPELNHHLLEGLLFPKTVINKIKFLFFNSSQYPDSIKKRFLVTQKVLKKQKIKFIEYQIKNKSKLSGSLEILFLGSWLSFYLTVFNEQNPTKIPSIDYFKQEMKK